MNQNRTILRQWLGAVLGAVIIAAVVPATAWGQETPETPVQQGVRTGSNTTTVNSTAVTTGNIISAGRGTTVTVTTADRTGESTPKVPKVTVTKITDVLAESATITGNESVDVNGTITLTANVTPTYADKVVWTVSDNTKAAFVSGSDLVATLETTADATTGTATATLKGRGEGDVEINVKATSDATTALNETAHAVSVILPPALGDAYYSDGSWGNQYHADGATIIGIVAWLGTDTDIKCGKPHGLVMAKSDVSSAQQWGGTVNESFLTDITRDAYNNNYSPGLVNYSKNGLANTDNLLADGHTHPAASAARNYTPAAPSTDGNTNWFLPSSAQWIAVMGSSGIGGCSASFTKIEFVEGTTSVFSNMNSRLTAKGCTALGTSSHYYWTSNELNYNSYINVVYVANAYENKVYFGAGGKTDTYYVRPFLAF